MRRSPQTTILKLTALVALALASGSAQRPGAVPLQDQAAQVVQMTGQVSVLRDGNQWALQVGDSVQVRQTVVTGPGGYAVFKVFDGSTIEVFPNSHFVFRSNLGSAGEDEALGGAKGFWKLIEDGERTLRMV